MCSPSNPYKDEMIQALPAALVLPWGDHKGRGLTLKVADELQEEMVQSSLTLKTQTTLGQGPAYTHSGSVPWHVN